MYVRLVLLWSCFGVLCSASSPSTYLPYALAVLVTILGAIVNDKKEWVWRFWNGKLEKQHRKRDDDIEAQSTEEAGKKMSETEYLFVDYVSNPPSEKRANCVVCDALSTTKNHSPPYLPPQNAWLFTGDRMLWVGLIRKMFDVVEQRIAKETTQGTDFKREWRIECAVRQLEKKYGHNFSS